MKSIYEASVAYGREHQGTVDIEVFEAGANFVLEQIENILKDKNAGLVEMWDELMTLVEQLKKKGVWQQKKKY